MALTKNPKLALIPNGYKASKVYSVLPSNGVGDFDFTRSGNATRVNKQGLIETVASNVPRLNYPLIDGVVSGCPSLLLEPQRINYIFPSNGFSSWYLGGVVTRTANYGISPDGTQNSTRADFDNGGIIYTSPNRPQGAYVFSVFAKNIEGGGSIIQLRIDIPATTTAEFDLSNGTIVSNNTDDAKIEDYGNGWYRCIIIQNNDEIYNTVIGEGTTELDCELFGAMLEEGSFASSYVPTTTSAATRSAETCNGAGDANTFNDSEGVLMAEISALADDGTIREIALSNGGTANRIEIRYSGSNIQGIVRFGSSVIVLTYNLADTTEFTKVALKYKSGDYSFWVNGLELQVDTTTGTPTGLSEFAFDDGNGNDDFYGNTKQLQYFDSVLNDSDLETLTSWTSFSEMAQSQSYKTY